MNHRFCETVRLGYGLATVVRTGTMKDGKIVLIAQHLLESSIGALHRMVS